MRPLRLLARLLGVGLLAAPWLAGAASSASGSTDPKPVPLAAYGANPAQTSVSGLSSGAFMAVQMQVAWSASIVGAGVIAGGPYYCAAGNLLFANICMGQVFGLPPNPYLMANAAKDFAAEGRIDALANLGRRRIYVFSGTDDSVVRQPAVDAAVSFFKLLGVADSRLLYVNTVPAGHAVITPSQGNDCGANAAPYISHCTVGGSGYDQAGALLTQIYGKLRLPSAQAGGQVVAFDQRAFAASDTGMADTGYLYVPKSCAVAGKSKCKVHVALHGCVQSVESVGRQFIDEAGYNAWADSNRLLVLYPQVNKSSTPFNPQGCWDWWGYTGPHYADKGAPQMKAIKAMVDRLAK